MRVLGRVMLVLLVASSASGAALAEPVAVLAALKGKVTIKAGRASDARSATFGTPLESGDRISVGPRGSATLFFNDGNVVELGSGSSMTIGGRVASGTVAGREQLPREAFLSVRNFQLAGSRERGLIAAPALRGTGDSDLPEPLAPRQTDLLAERPTFRWRAVPGAVRYSVTLLDEKGVMWSRESDSLLLEFPADAAALAAGEYVWDVQAHGAGGPVGKASATFRVVPGVQADAVRSVVERMRQSAGGDGSAAASYMAGAYLYDHGFLVDAVHEFTRLTELEPGAPEAQVALGDAYRAMGILDRAAAAYARAKELSAAP